MTGSLNHFSKGKRLLQKLGSRVVGFVAGAEVTDAASGFRAYSKLAVAKLFITTRFSYAMESIIQAGNKGLQIISVETGAKHVNRPSRLFKSSFQHVRKSARAILKSFLMYKPLQIFSILAIILFSAGMLPLARYLILVIAGAAGDHIQSLILGSLLISSALLSLVLGLVAELSRIHREMFEEEQALERLSGSTSLTALLTSFGAVLVPTGSQRGFTVGARLRPEDREDAN